MNEKQERLCEKLKEWQQNLDKTKPLGDQLDELLKDLSENETKVLYSILVETYNNGLKTLLN